MINQSQKNQRKNHNWRLTSISLLLVLISCSFKNESQVFEVLIEKNGEKQLTLVFKNISDKKYLLPSNILLTGDILKFENASNVDFTGVMVDRVYPHHIDKKSVNFDIFLENDCYLNDTVNYRVILPNHSFILKYNVYDHYASLKIGEHYTIQYELKIDEEYSNYCPLIWHGILQSNKIEF
ncbi:MAG: hypothetical protein Q8O72_01365 [Bacteroidales bacterium]|nr:hypothetical protein [Bacteroidales bacterium]